MRHAFRSLLKSPGFTCVAVLALALGIGANTAIFSVVYGVLLRPLPFPDQERLVSFTEWSERVPTMSLSYPNYVDFRERQKAFTSIGVSRSHSINLAGPTEAERIPGASASYDLFQTLGVPPLLGRVYDAGEDNVGAERTVVLSEKLWRRAFGGRGTVLGEQIQLNGQLHTIIGVMPATFAYPSAATEVWIPLGHFADQFKDRGNHPGLTGVARLKPGLSYDAGVADLKSVAAQLAAEFPDSNARQSVNAQPLTDRAFGRVKPTLYVLLGAASFVLLIACANVANLQLARAHARSREFAVRAALGAGRGRIIRQLLLESVLLGGMGCVAGIVLGIWGLDALRAILPANTPRIDEVSLNAPVLGFAIVISLLTSIAFGLVPALHAARLDLRDALAQGGRSGSAGGNRWRATLIVAEVALTSVLLVGAGLMIRTLSNLYSSNPGYATGQVLTAGWNVTGPTYAKGEQRAPMFERALRALSALPGAERAALINPLPLSGNGSQDTYYAEGSPLPERGRQPAAEYFVVSPDAFDVLRIPLLAGRGFTAHDTATAPKVAVVDTVFAEKNFPGQNPIGKRFTYDWEPAKDEQEWVEIVGLVAHIQNYGPAQATREQTYVPYTQRVPAAASFVVRTSQPPAALAAAVRAAIREVAPTLPGFAVQPMDDLFKTNISNQRLSVFLLGTFAALALLLAALGLYGVLAYNVGQRTREIGLRMALGATPGAVVALILRHGLKLGAAGLVVGLVAALGLTRVLEKILYEVSAFDPVSFGAVAAVLTAIALFACWLPARRATKVDPMEALRAD